MNDQENNLNSMLDMINELKSAMTEEQAQLAAQAATW